jgi:SpoVK/Ycf46/Vps4 family AAA+-type ATPase
MGAMRGLAREDLSRAVPPPPSEEDQPIFSAESPIRSLDDLIALQAVRERIEAALSLIRNHETLFLAWNLAKIDPYHKGTAINLYGPSGTGKSLCAEAVAHEIGRPFINVNYAQIESRYVGQTPKNIESAFDAASTQGAVLIFDEADAMLGRRLSNVTQSADHAVKVSRTTMLRQLDRFDGLVVFTTNFPENYDAAFVRRILTHIRFELPDQETLRRLWTHMIPAELPVAEDVELDTLRRRIPRPGRRRPSERRDPRGHDSSQPRNRTPQGNARRPPQGGNVGAWPGLRSASPRQTRKSSPGSPRPKPRTKAETQSPIRYVRRGPLKAACILLPGWVVTALLIYLYVKGRY